MKRRQPDGYFLPGVVLAWLVLLLPGCRDEGTHIPVVANIDAAFEMSRFDRALFELDSTVSDSQLVLLQDAFPAFWPLYFSKILPLSQIPKDRQRESQYDNIRTVLADQRLQAVADTVFRKYPDLEGLEREFYDAFQFYRYYFPSKASPNVYTLISDFGFFPFIFIDENGRDAIGISLEMFLGAEFPYVKFAGNHPMFSAYMIRTYNRDHIVRKSIEVLVDDLMGPPPGDRLLDLMIHNGKKLYVMEKVLPYTPDTILFEFTPEQVTWCYENERNLWAHYLTEDLLYSNEYLEINKLVNYSPNIPGLPPEAPGRVANWSGWRIISQLQERNPDLTLSEIVAMRNAQEVLEKARYKPR